MNRNDFINLILDTGQIDRQMVGEVRDLLGLFPWFQSAHMLLLKGLHNTEDVKFENQLRQSALHIADREVLYYLLSGKPERKPSVTRESAERPEPEDELTDNYQVVIDSGKSSKDLINILEKDTADQESVDQATVPGDLQTDSMIVFAVDSDTDESASLVLIIDDGENKHEETVVFMDPSFATMSSHDLLELDETAPEMDSSDIELIEEEMISGREPVSKKKMQADLIDRFIETNPRIEPSKEKSDLPNEDISKAFVEEKGGFVTETLARIYIKQGYYSRAIDIYEKLSLKFPEKSSYFATQIQKVNSLIK